MSRHESHVGAREPVISALESLMGFLVGRCVSTVAVDQKALMIFHKQNQIKLKFNFEKLENP